MKYPVHVSRLIGFMIGSTAWCLALSFGCNRVWAQEPKNDIARITAIEPAALIRGTKATLKIRGFQLKEASALRFPSSVQVMGEIKEKKDAEQPKGLENKTVGDTQLLVDVSLPSDLPPGVTEFVIATTKGDATGKVMIIAESAVVEEKEPNDGFREAQVLKVGLSARGSIQGDKDVDVYMLTEVSGERLKIRVITGGPLLIDAALQCYDSHGQLLAGADDSTSRDPELELSVPKDKSLFLCVSSAHDIGGEWHSYVLAIEEVK